VRLRSLLLGVALLAVTSTQATTATTSATDPALGMMASINSARVARGLVPLRSDPRLWAIADERAGRLAASGILSHEAAGSLAQDLTTHGVSWYGYGEDIGYASGSPAVVAPTILAMWTASSAHWPLLMSERSNYVGIGLAYRPDSGVTFASVVLSESPDRTGACAAIAGAIVSGDDIRWSWRGWDTPLQTHMAGLRDFTLQLRRDLGAWLTIGSGLTATALTLADRTRGHWYGLRVRARDRVGNVGAWSREFRVWLP
jgi:uncharacterized protein YkwD